MTSPRVALATCGEFPDLEVDDRLLLPALRALGVEGVPAVWDDPDVDWGSFDLTVLRSTWDYSRRYEAFLDWAAQVEAVSGLANPVPAVRWNTDKTYLAQLADREVPVVPTTFLHPGEPHPALPATGEFVVKPTVSAGSRDTARYLAGRDDEVAQRHVDGLLDRGRSVMVQPYIDSVDTAGETGLLHIDGTYSHAIRKGALLGSGAPPTTGLFAQEDIRPRTPSPAQREVAAAVIDALPAHLDGWLYCRVDLLDTAGGPVLLEVEMTEPSLFLRTSSAAPARLAQAILSRLG